MDFLIYDIIFLVLFIILVSFFLYSKRENLKKQGLLFLYRTKWGINLINKIGNKYKKTLKVLSYVSVFISYILMIIITYLIIDSVYLYLTTSIAKTITAPPITPLIPYFPQIFGLQSFFPPFYFTYFIISILIVATVHEFSHGIFAAYNKIKIKTTGFGFFPYFLPIFLAAFVELDEKRMAKKSTFNQRSILSAGVFANVITAIFFFAIWGIFFSLAFAPSGVVFNSYSYNIVPVTDITMINNVSLSSPNASEIVSLIGNGSNNKIDADGMKFVGIKGFSSNKQFVALYDDAPAINAKLDPIILEMNGKKITSIDSFRSELLKYKPGDAITLVTKGNMVEEKTIILGKNPENESLPFLGLASVNESSKSIVAKFLSGLISFKKTNVYYEPKIGNLSQFLYDLLWWVMIINLLVALMNMLPVGIFDGGRFFYLTVLAITKKEKIAKGAYKFLTYFFLLLLLVLMVVWVLSL